MDKTIKTPRGSAMAPPLNDVGWPWPSSPHRRRPKPEPGLLPGRCPRHPWNPDGWWCNPWPCNALFVYMGIPCPLCGLSRFVLFMVWLIFFLSSTDFWFASCPLCLLFVSSSCPLPLLVLCSSSSSPLLSAIIRPLLAFSYATTKLCQNVFYIFFVLCCCGFFFLSPPKLIPAQCLSAADFAIWPNMSLHQIIFTHTCFSTRAALRQKGFGQAVFLHKPCFTHTGFFAPEPFDTYIPHMCLRNTDVFSTRTPFTPKNPEKTTPTSFYPRKCLQKHVFFTNPALVNRFFVDYSDKEMHLQLSAASPLPWAWRLICEESRLVGNDAPIEERVCLRALVVGWIQAKKTSHAEIDIRSSEAGLGQL